MWGLKRLIPFLLPPTFQLGYDHSHIDRLTGEKQSVTHVHGHSQQHEPSKDSEAALGTDDILGLSSEHERVVCR